VCAVKATAAADQVRTAATGGYPVLDHAPARPPLIGDYAERLRTFTWDQARSWLAPEPGGRLNIAHQAVQRHVDAGRGGVVAVRFLDRTAPRRELTYAELADAVARFAAVLSELGVGRGDRVCTLLPRSPELFVTALGTLWNGSVYCPLFPAFGPGPVQQRLELGHRLIAVAVAGTALRAPLGERVEMALQTIHPELVAVLLRRLDPTLEEVDLRGQVTALRAALGRRGGEARREQRESENEHGESTHRALPLRARGCRSPCLSAGRPGE